MKKLIRKIRQLFCRHDYKEFVEKVNGLGFQVISGETIYIACPKCEHIKGSYFKPY